MIASTPSAIKYAPAALAPAFMVLDWHLIAAMAFGFVSGWLARAARKKYKRSSWAEICDDLLLSVLIAGGSVIIVLSIVRILGLDPLGAALSAFLLAWMGIAGFATIADGLSEALRERLERHGLIRPADEDKENDD
tara:strand:- start:574 stop:981 length:408 start_codon:yes stop_codon:yes gene_type:complete